MVIAERITSYNVRVIQTNFLSHTRIIMLKTESGTTIHIAFPQVRPVDWLQFTPGAVSLFMTDDLYDDVYHMLQTEDPVFCTALNIFGFQVGSVHTELDLNSGEPTGEGYQDGSLESLIVRARREV